MASAAAGMAANISLYSANKGTIEISDTTPQAEYSESNLTAYSAEEYKSKYGKTLDEMFIYIISEETILNPNTQKVDGGYVIDIDLHTDWGTANYKKQMVSVSDLDAKPKFEKVHLTFNLDSELMLHKMTVDEKYTARKVVDASINGKLEIYYFLEKFIEIPGADGMLDLTTYLTGGPVYGQRNGSLSFKIANGIENIETIRSKMVNTIHGKRMAIVLDDDPDYYYEGRFTVGNIEPASDYSGITITYQLDTYKLRIKSYGSDYPTLWDTFNFETDYDYSILYPSVIVNNSTKTFYIYAENYPFQLSAIWVSGNVDVSFGGVTKNLHAAGSVNLGTASNGSNTLTITGTGSVKIYWRGGSL